MTVIPVIRVTFWMRQKEPLKKKNHKSSNVFINMIALIVRVFYVMYQYYKINVDTHHLNIISIISCFDIFSVSRAIFTIKPYMLLF